MNSPYALVLLADKSHIEYTKQVYYTAAKFGNWKYDFVLLAFDLTNDIDWSWFDAHKIKIVHFNNDTQWIKEIVNNSELYPQKVYFVKYYLFHPFFSNYKKIIYLDTDVIIRKDINSLLKYKTFAAASDFFNAPIVFQFNELNRPYEESKINQHLSQNTLKKISFNTGLMLIQSAQNTEEQFNEIINLNRLYSKYAIFPEQGILNIFFVNKWKRISHIYNDFYASEPNDSCEHIGTSKKHSAILHIVRPCKPWHKKSPFYNEWFLNWEESNKEWHFNSQGKKASCLSKIIIDSKLFWYLFFTKKYNTYLIKRQYGYYVWYWHFVFKCQKIQSKLLTYLKGN